MAKRGRKKGSKAHFIHVSKRCPKGKKVCYCSKSKASHSSMGLKGKGTYVGTMKWRGGRRNIYRVKGGNYFYRNKSNQRMKIDRYSVLTRMAAKSRSEKVY